MNYFDPRLYYPKEKFLEKFVKEKKIIIGTVANVSPVKDLTFFIETAEKLSSYSKEIVFLVVGSVHNSQKKYYQNLLNTIYKSGMKNIFFLGSRRDTRPILKLMDIYVCSSKNESSPLALWEAMAMEKAIISTDVGDVSKFITNGLNGFVINTGDKDALTKHIVKLINEPILRDNLGKSAREVAKSKLDLKICTDLHFKMYQSVFNCY